MGNSHVKNIAKFIFIIILISSSVSAISWSGGTTTIVNQTIISGNLTNLSQMVDVNIPSPNDGDSLTYDSGSTSWIASVINDLWESISGTTQLKSAENVSLQEQSITDILSTVYNVSGCGESDVEGTVCWSADDMTLNVVTGLGNVIQVGQEMTGVGLNKEGVIMRNGQVATLSGSVGEQPTVVLADASNNSRILNPAVVTIPNCNINAACPVTTFGFVRDMDTSAWAEGAKLYLSADGSGNLTDTPPVFPNYIIWVATVVRSHASTGKILVLPTLDWGNGVTLNSLGVRTNLNVTGNATITGVLNVGGASPIFQDPGDIFATGRIFGNNGSVFRAENYGVGTMVERSGGALNFTSLGGTANFTAEGVPGDYDAIICDYSNPFVAGHKGKFLTVLDSTPSYTGGTGEISSVLNSTCIEISVASSGARELVNATSATYGVYDHPLFAVLDRGFVSIEIGSNKQAKFEVHIPNGTGSHGFLIEDVAGADSHQAMEIEVDGKGYDGVVGIDNLIFSSEPVDGKRITNLLLEEDGTNVDNSYGTFIVMNLIGQGSGTIADGIVVDPNLRNIVTMGSAEIISKAYYNELDVTAAFTDTSNDTELFTNVDDYVYVGNTENFTTIGIALSTTSSKDISPEYLYCLNNGTWKTLSGVTDTTDGWTSPGTITFTNPTDRGKCNNQVNGSSFANTTNYTYVAIKRTRIAIPGVKPIESLISISGGTTSMYIDKYGMKPLGSAGAPYTCDATRAGQWYYDTTSTALLWCTGAAWVEFAETADITVHNNLAGLQGGVAAEYYHLNASEHTDRWLSAGGGNIIKSSGEVNVSNNFSASSIWIGSAIGMVFPAVADLWAFKIAEGAAPGTGLRFDATGLVEWRYLNDPKSKLDVVGGVQYFKRLVVEDSLTVDTDWTNTAIAGTKDDTGSGDGGSRIGVAGEATANATAQSIGVVGVAKATNDNIGSGVSGIGTVSNTADVQDARGVSAAAASAHTGGNNIAVYADARNGANNYSFYGVHGELYNNGTGNFTQPVYVADSQVCTAANGLCGGSGDVNFSYMEDFGVAFYNGTALETNTSILSIDWQQGFVGIGNPTPTAILSMLVPDGANKDVFIIENQDSTNNPGTMFIDSSSAGIDLQISKSATSASDSYGLYVSTLNNGGGESVSAYFNSIVRIGTTAGRALLNVRGSSSISGDIFQGSGLDDANFSGIYLGKANSTFRVQIDGAGNGAAKPHVPFLNSTGTNYEDSANLTINTLHDDNASLKNIYDYRTENVSIMSYHLPFEGVSNSTFTKGYSTFSNNGTVTGIEFNATGGIDGFGAYEYSNGDQDNITIDNTDFPDTVPGTVLIWVKPKFDGDDGVIHDIFQADTAASTGWFITKFSDSNMYFDVVDSAGSRCFTNVAGWNANEWHQVGLRWNGATSQGIIDGAVVCSVAQTLAASTNLLFVGNSQFKRPFNGTIDDFRVYNTNLSIQQIKALYDNQTEIIVARETYPNQNWSAEVTRTNGTDDLNTSITNSVEIDVTAKQFGFPTPFLNSSNAVNYTTITNLTVNTLFDSNSTVKIIYDWRQENISIAKINMPFEGGSNSSWTKDYSTFSSNGSIDNPVWNSTGGHDGFGAYYFDGNDEITLGNISDAGLDLQQASYSFWFTPKNTISGDSGEQYIIDIGSRSAVGLYLLEGGAGASNGELSAAYFDGTAQRGTNSGVTAFTAGTWYHVVYTLDTVGNEQKIYLDGVLKDTTTWSASVAYVTTRQAGYGAHILGSEDWFNGTLDDVLIYDRILTQEQVTALSLNQTDLIAAQELANNENWSSMVTINDGIADISVNATNSVEIGVSNITQSGSNIDTFRWYLDEVLQASGIAILPGVKQGLSDGINITFDSDSGHTLWDNTSIGTVGRPVAEFFRPDGNLAMGIYPNGDVNITGELYVNGSKMSIPDYVFESNYSLPTLTDLAVYVATEKHLPGVKSEEEIKSGGLISIVARQNSLLEKIEEAFLYLIDHEERIIELETEIADLEARILALEKPVVVTP